MKTAGRAYLGRWYDGERARLTAGFFALQYRRLPKWRNWQTRYVQGVVSLCSCGFDSHLRHQRVRLWGEASLAPKSLTVS